MSWVAQRIPNYVLSQAKVKPGDGEYVNSCLTKATKIFSKMEGEIKN